MTVARAIWSGAISFGLVNVPVKVFTAVREHAVHFHQVEKRTGARIRYEKVSERSGKEVGSEDIELGYELTRGQLVTVDPEQLSDLRPRTTRTIDISDFVDLSQIDPVFYDRTYWLAPDGEVAHRPYGLLFQAMQDRNRAGIGTVVMRNKQYLAAIRPREGALAMSTMHFADEIVSRSSVEGMTSGKAKPAVDELKLAAQIVDALSTDWDPGRYKDTYTGQVKDFIERQAAGKNIVVERSPAKDAEVLDLVAALEASLKTAKDKKRSGSPSAPRAKDGRKASSRGGSGPSAPKNSRRRSA